MKPPATMPVTAIPIYVTGQAASHDGMQRSGGWRTPLEVWRTSSPHLRPAPAITTPGWTTEPSSVKTGVSYILWTSILWESRGLFWVLYFFIVYSKSLLPESIEAIKIEELYLASGHSIQGWGQVRSTRAQVLARTRKLGAAAAACPRCPRCCGWWRGPMISCCGWWRGRAAPGCSSACGAPRPASACSPSPSSATSGAKIISTNTIHTLSTH